MRKTPFIYLLGFAILAPVGGSAVPTSALAGVVIQHVGANDPTTEGFLPLVENGSGSVGAVTGDLGHDSWQINASDPTSQYSYRAFLTGPQKTDALTTGWRLSMDARVMATGSGPESSAVALASFGGVRFDINLFLTPAGDTTVRLDTSLNASTGSIVHPKGPSYILSGNAYHAYSLVFDPNSHTASLLVDGTERITGYAGTTEYSTTNAVLFGSNDDGIGRFAHFEFDTGPSIATPVPSTLVMSSILFGIFGMVWSYKRMTATTAAA